MYEVLTDFLEQLPGLSDIADLETLCAETLRNYGVEHFICTSMYGLECSPDRKPMFGSWDSDWCKIYIARSYYVEDAITQYKTGLESDLKPYYWSELQEKKQLTPIQCEIFRSAWDAGLKEGIVFPIEVADDELALYSMGAPELKKDKARKGVLWSIALESHKVARRILLKEYGPRQMPNRIAVAATPAVHSLTPQELHVVELLAEDKSPTGIAKINKVSINTVRKQIASAKRKLEVDELPGLVAVAQRYSLIP